MARWWWLASLILLAGCGGPSRPLLRVGKWGAIADDSDFSRVQQEIYAEFERRHGIEIQVEGTPGSQDYVRKILLSYVAKAEPDVITLDASSAAAFIENGVLKDLTPFAEQEFDLDAYFPNVVDVARRGDKLYAIPLDFTPMVMYCNRDLFKKFGVPLPRDDWNRAEFLATAKKLTQGDQYGFTFANWMPGWIMWLWNGGGDVLSSDGKTASGFLNSPASVASLEFIASLPKEHKVAPSLSEAAATGIDLFANERAAMTISGHWALVQYQKMKEKLHIVPLPRESVESQTVIYQAGLSIGAHSKQPELAWKFVQYMTSREVQTKLNATGIAVCARKDVAEAAAKRSELERQFLQIVPTGRGPWGAKVEVYDFIEAEGQKMMDAILQGDLTAQQAADQTAKKIDERLARP